MGIIQAIFLFLRAFILGRAAAAVENLALRQQVAVFKQSVKRPKLRPRDRVFWVWLSRLWPNWRSALAIVQPETVIKWHRKGFKLYWRWKSRAGKPGRPPIEREIRDLIRRMSRENPTWGAPRIVSELALLGHDVAEADRGQVHGPHAETAFADLANVPGQSRSRHRRLRLLHGSDRHFPRPVRLHRAPSRPATGRPLQRDHESLRRMDRPANHQRLPVRGSTTFSHSRSRRHLRRLLQEARRKAWGSKKSRSHHARLGRIRIANESSARIRRECLDHVIVLNERHLHRILTDYFDYYHNSRPHLSLDRNSPTPREVEPPSQGEVISIPQVGGLHHRYSRAA